MKEQSEAECVLEARNAFNFEENQMLSAIQMNVLVRTVEGL
jgi:hypothetical protein